MVLGAVLGIVASAEGDAAADSPASGAAKEASAERVSEGAHKNERRTSEARHAPVDQRVRTSGRCPAGTIEVEGDYCPVLEQRCLRYEDPEGAKVRRCAEFAPSGACQAPTVKKHFCVDEFEFPNRAGATPTVMKTWHEAAAACKAHGKRLCGDSEWTLACEGREHLAYPYGSKRDPEACNIDKPHRDWSEKALLDPKTRDAEIARLWQGEPSGARTACVSPYGVRDMTGNVDEWVVNEAGQPYKSGLKGGYWGQVRDRCRPTTRAHNEDFSSYQVGFRCCSDPS